MLENIVSFLESAVALASNIAFYVAVALIVVGAVYILLRFSFVIEMTETSDEPFVEQEQADKRYAAAEKAIKLAENDRNMFFYLLGAIAVAIVANEYFVPFGDQTRYLSWFFLIGAFVLILLGWLSVQLNRSNFDRKWAEYETKLAPNEG